VSIDFEADLPMGLRADQRSFEGTFRTSIVASVNLIRAPKVSSRHAKVRAGIGQNNIEEERSTAVSAYLEGQRIRAPIVQQAHVSKRQHVRSAENSSCTAN
jgi:hypothetical protein